MADTKLRVACTMHRAGGAIVFVSEVSNGSGKEMELLFSDRGGSGAGWHWDKKKPHEGRRRRVTVPGEKATFVASAPIGQLVHGDALRLIHSDLRPRLLLSRLMPTPVAVEDVYHLEITLPGGFEPVFTNGTDGPLRWMTCKRLDPYLLARATGAPWRLVPDEGTPTLHVLARDAAESKEVITFVRGQLAKLEGVLGKLDHYREVLLDLGVPWLGAMEHPAAIRATRRSLGHELVHLWFGTHYRAPGLDALWFDEAVASLLCEEELPDLDAIKDPILGLRTIGATTTPWLAYSYGAAALAKQPNVHDFLMKLFKEREFALHEDVLKWVGDDYAPQHADPELPSDVMRENKELRVIERGFPRRRRGSKLLAEGAAQEGEIWEGLIFVKDPNDALKAVGYRTQVVQDEATEFWVMEEGTRLNPSLPGYKQWKCVTPTGTDPGFEDFQDFKDWVTAMGALTPPLEAFVHTVQEIVLS